MGYALNVASGNLIGITTPPTAIAIRQEMDLNSLKLTAISGSVVGAATAVSLSALSGVIPGLVWNETMTGHQTTGSTGYALNAASGNLIAGTWATTSAVPTVAQIRAEMDSSSLKLTAISGIVVGAATAVSLSALSGVLISRTIPSGEYTTSSGVWTYNIRTLTSAGSAGATAQEVWEYSSGRSLTIPVSVSGIVDANIVKVSGEWVTVTNVVPANVVQVSGEYVSLADFGGGDVTVGGVIDANIVSISGVPVNIDATSVADSDELSALGNLLLRNARIIRLLP
jgi:hypothetical protein